MISVLTPARRMTPEFLDDPATDLASVTRSGDDIAQCNRLFGGTRAVLAELTPVWRELGASATLLDVGCGVGDLTAAMRAAAAKHDVTLHAVALDRRAELAARAASRAEAGIVADAFSLPFADHSVDVVTACQILHHIPDGAIAPFVRELDRVARVRVVISDLRRNWLAAGGVWLASWPLGFHPITRHDGVASVLKGFVPHELRAVIAATIGHDVAVSSRPAFRVTATWKPQ
jgi:SAM-dependent methyltransferase